MIPNICDLIFIGLTKEKNPIRYLNRFKILHLKLFKYGKIGNY